MGDGAVEIRKVASLSAAAAGDLVFVQSAQHLEEAMSSKAGAVIAGEFAATHAGPKPLLIARHPRLAFARAGALLHPRKDFSPGIDATAVVDPTAKIAASSAIDEHAVIEANAVIGEHSHIGAGCSVGEGVVIGRDCAIYPRAVLYPGVKLGDRVIVHAGAVLGSDGFGFVRDDSDGRYYKFPQIGTLLIENDVEIGANCTIDRGALDETVIRTGTKLDNMVHVGHNAQIGSNVVIAAQTGISGSCVIEDSVIVGGQVGLADHTRVESGAILGAQSGIPSNKIIRGKGVVFWGTPARPIGQYLKELAALSKLARGRRKSREAPDE